MIFGKSVVCLPATKSGLSPDRSVLKNPIEADHYPTIPFVGVLRCLSRDRKPVLKARPFVRAVAEGMKSKPRGREEREDRRGERREERENKLLRYLLRNPRHL
eukprot:SAG11_NODE_2105_length_3813_cov_2.468767_3_plen_103_part_00